MLKILLILFICFTINSYGQSYRCIDDRGYEYSSRWNCEEIGHTSVPKKNVKNKTINKYNQKIVNYNTAFRCKDKSGKFYFSKVDCKKYGDEVINNPKTYNVKKVNKKEKITKTIKKRKCISYEGEIIYVDNSCKSNGYLSYEGLQNLNNDNKRFCFNENKDYDIVSNIKQCPNGFKELVPTNYGNPKLQNEAYTFDELNNAPKFKRNNNIYKESPDLSYDRCTTDYSYCLDDCSNRYSKDILGYSGCLKFCEDYVNACLSAGQLKGYLGK